MDKRALFAVPVLVLLTLAIWPDPLEVYDRPPLMFPGGARKLHGPFWSYENYCVQNHSGVDLRSPTVVIEGFSTLLISVTKFDICTTDGRVLDASGIYASIGWRPANSRLPELGFLSSDKLWVIGILSYNGATPYLALDRSSPTGETYISWYGSPYCRSAEIDDCRLNLGELLTFCRNPLPEVSHPFVELPATTIAVVDYDASDEHSVFLPVSTGLVSELAGIGHAELEHMLLRPVPTATPTGSD